MRARKHGQGTNSSAVEEKAGRAMAAEEMISAAAGHSGKEVCELKLRGYIAHWPGFCAADDYTVQAVALLEV
jgi:hypothetical protein